MEGCVQHPAVRRGVRELGEEAMTADKDFMAPETLKAAF